MADKFDRYTLALISSYTNLPLSKDCPEIPQTWTSPIYGNRFYLFEDILTYDLTYEETISFEINMTYHNSSMYRCIMLSGSDNGLVGCYFQNNEDVDDEDENETHEIFTSFVKNRIRKQFCPNLKNLIFKIRGENIDFSFDFFPNFFGGIFSNLNFNKLNLFFHLPLRQNERFTPYLYGLKNYDVYIHCSWCSRYREIGDDFSRYIRYVGRPGNGKQGTWYSMSSEQNWFRPVFFDITKRDDGCCIYCFAENCLELAIENNNTAVIKSISDTGLLGHTDNPLSYFYREIGGDFPG